MQQLALDVSAHDVISTPPVLQAVTTKKAIAPVAELPNRKPSEAIGTGSLTEMILSENSTIHPVQMLPLLAQCDTHTRWLMWLSPNRTINKRSEEHTSELQSRPHLECRLMLEKNKPLHNNTY